MSRKSYHLVGGSTSADSVRWENRTAEWVRFHGVGLRARATTVEVEGEATKRVLKECFDV